MLQPFFLLEVLIFKLYVELVNYYKNNQLIWCIFDRRGVKQYNAENCSKYQYCSYDVEMSLISFDSMPYLRYIQLGIQIV